MAVVVDNIPLSGTVQTTKHKQGDREMTTANANKKLVAAGFEVKESGPFIVAKKGRYVIDLTKNGGDLASTIATIRVRASNDLDHNQSDYSAGVYCDNVSQAIRLAR